MHLLALIDHFKEHCDTIGIRLLKDDLSFLRARLNGLKTNDAKSILKAYAKRWLEAEEKGLAGRREANTALRTYIDGK